MKNNRILNNLPKNKKKKLNEYYDSKLFNPLKITLKKSLIFKNNNLKNLLKNSFENYEKTIFEQCRIFYFLKKKLKLN